MTQKRKAQGDGNPNSSKSRTRDRGGHLASTKAIFERFLAAYRGEHADALGSDAPPTDLFRQKECVVFVSTSSSSRLLSAPHESTTYIYDTFSQNAAIELRMWVSDGQHSQRFTHVRSLVINAEVMAAPLVRIQIPYPSPVAVRDALKPILPQISTKFDDMWAVLRPWKGTTHGVDCLTFRLKKSKIWTRKQRGCGNDSSNIAQELDGDIDNLEYISIIRASEPQELHFVDDFWEYQLERCRKDGIYWGYNIKQEMAKLPNGKDDLPYTHQILRGLYAAPHLSWFKRVNGPKSGPNDWLSHPFRATFTSIEEWEIVFTLALLQDVEWDRTSTSNAYASIGSQSMRVVEDEKDPSHFWLHITATATGSPLPKVTAGTVFTLYNAATTDSESTTETLEGRAVDIEGCTDLVLELRVKGKNKKRPWGDDFRTGFQSQVSLNPNVNIQSPLRQLNAIEFVKYTANKADIDVLIGRPARNHRLDSGGQFGVNNVVYNDGMAHDQTPERSRSEHAEDSDVDMDRESDSSSILSEPSRMVTKSTASFQKSLEILRDQDFVSYQAHIDWQTTGRFNRLQYSSITSGLQNEITFVQGPPGTGKSDVACTEALWIACLGKNVLMAGPTNAAGKSNATKLSRNISQHVSWILRTNLQCVYFPTWKESIDRIYEHCGCQMPMVTQPGDENIEQFQIWRLVSEYALRRVECGQKDDKAKSFVDTLRILRASAGHTSMMNDKSEREDLTSNFKHLAGQYLAQKKLNFIVISTCNNCAVLDRMAIKFDFLIIDEAGAGLEYDIAVALQIKHQGVLILGDHLQGRPVIESKGHNDFYDQASISGFERALQFTEQERTMLRISYRFGEQIADGVGIFGGYGGLASGVTLESAFYKEFERFWTSNENPYRKNLVLPPAEARHHKAMREGHKSYHRLALNVADGHSSLASKGNSTVNFANVDAGITFLMHVVSSCSAMVTGNDIMIGTPFLSQAEIWRQQLSIRWPESGIEVLTGGISQGKERRLMVADFTVANQTEGAFLGFLAEWNRPNVLESRGQDVLINLFNFDLMRPRLQSLYLQNPTWAYFILDHLDAGEIYTVGGSSILPGSEEEFYGTRESWTLVQRQSDVKNLYYTAIRPSQTVPLRGPNGSEQYTPLEKKYLKELSNIRLEANSKIKWVLKSEQEWQEFWAKEKTRLGEGILDDFD